MWLSMDWGNSVFRLHAVEEERPPRIRWSHRTRYGAQDAWKAWKRDPRGRTQAQALRAALARLIFDALKEHGVSPEGLDAVVSGMACSSIGIGSLPYARCPFPLDGSALIHRRFPADAALAMSLHVVSGLCDENTVVRGEETLLVGLHALDPDRFREPVTVVMPGTHSVHVAVERGVAQSATTFMTGELFGLLRRESILSQSVHEDPLSDEDADGDAFGAGVEAAQRDGALRHLFRVRARDLLEHRNRHENTCFLSGLLIGAEGADLARRRVERVLLACGEATSVLYRRAFARCGIPQVRPVPPRELDEALVAGQSLVRAGSADGR